MSSDPRKKVLVCVVVPTDRGEVSILTAQSLVKLQARLMTAPSTDLSIDMFFVRSFDDALQTLWKAREAHAVFAVDGSLGFSPEFVVGAARSDLPVVVGTYPLPTVDWSRVKAMPPGEPPEEWGNVYNVALQAKYDKHGYALVNTSVAPNLGIAFIKRSALEAIVAARPDVAASEEADFATPGLYDGKKLSPYERFLSLYTGDVWADIQRPGTTMGITEFGGCVGARAALR